MGRIIRGNHRPYYTHKALASFESYAIVSLPIRGGCKTATARTRQKNPNEFVHILVRVAPYVGVQQYPVHKVVGLKQDVSPRGHLCRSRNAAAVIMSLLLDDNGHVRAFHFHNFLDTPATPPRPHRPAFPVLCLATDDAPTDGPFFFLHLTPTVSGKSERVPSPAPTSPALLLGSSPRPGTNPDRGHCCCTEMASRTP